MSAPSRSVLVLGAHRPGGRLVAERLRAAGDRVVAAEGDPADATVRREGLERTLAAHGSIDVLVLPPPADAQAPVYPWSSAAAEQNEHALRSAFFCIQDAARAMTGGRIALASPRRSADTAMPIQTTMLEGAFVALVRLLAVELAPSGVSVNGLCPVTSDAHPDAIASALVFLSSAEASYMTGAVLPAASARTSEQMSPMGLRSRASTE
jgi:NAD(P)-dependent dehydrogenase (short-subunit alcohol dehydrogenase family)